MARQRKLPPRLSDAPDRATVAAGFVTGMLAGLRAKGVSIDRLVQEAGLPAGILRDPTVRLPVTDYAAFYNHVVRDIDDEGFALFSAPLRAGTFEFLCRAVVASPTLEAALERAGRFLRIVLPDVRVTVERDRERARLVIAERRRLRPGADDPARVFAFEWLLRLLHALACWLAARALPLDEVTFPYPAPAHAADYSLIYTEHPKFGGAELVATFEAAFLALPVRRDERELATFLADAPGKIALLYRRDREMARAVRDILSGAFGCPLDEAARRLHVSSRTLHRRLREEATSFRAVKEALRRDIALDRIRKTRDSVAEIAADLGYSEPSAFFRAFLSWTGHSPTAHRRMHRLE
jgi:AraC-like DNA-binding protein